MDELIKHVAAGKWGEALAAYPGPEVVAEDGRLGPLESAALLALDDARRAGRRAWLIWKSDEAAWERAGAPKEGGQFVLVSVHARPREAAARLAWLLDGEVTWLASEVGTPDEETEHDALSVLCDGKGPAAFLAGMKPGEAASVGATGGDVLVFAL